MRIDLRSLRRRAPVFCRVAALLLACGSPGTAVMAQKGADEAVDWSQLGQANEDNLRHMLERPDDDRAGRQTGPAMAAPLVRAARRLIDGAPTAGTRPGASSAAPAPAPASAEDARPAMAADTPP